MVDVVSIVIAVISLTGTVLVTILNAWFGYFSDERKRRQDAERLLSKYRDPLLLACQELQSRLFNLTDGGITYYFAEDRSKDAAKSDDVLLYTAYVLGQYLSWTYIIRRQAQFLPFSVDEMNVALTKTLGQIRFEMSIDRGAANSGPFMLWRGEQLAIGEVMTVKDGDELYPMRYADFREQWTENRPDYDRKTYNRSFEAGNGTGDVGDCEDEAIWLGNLRPWFRSIVEGVKLIARAKQAGDQVPDHRLRRLQHLLLDLIKILDPKNLRSDARWTTACNPAPGCPCSSSSLCPLP